jgi:hypothetical protein
MRQIVGWLSLSVNIQQGWSSFSSSGSKFAVAGAVVDDINKCQNDEYD